MAPNSDSTADAAGPAYVISPAAPGTIRPFSIDATAFARWIAAKGDELQYFIPTATREHEDPAARLADLICDAQAADVITGDHRLELQLTADDHDSGSGFYVIVRNCSGEQRFVGLTSGWTALWLPRPTEQPAPADAAHRHLEEVCDIANRLISAV